MTEKTNERSVSNNPLEPLPIVRVLFLGFIKQHPHSTGYDLMRLISEFTDGRVELKSGTTYSELRRLESQKMVESIQEEEGRKRRTYTITSSGQKELSQLVNQMKKRVESFLRPILSRFD